MVEVELADLRDDPADVARDVLDALWTPGHHFVAEVVRVRPAGETWAALAWRATKDPA